MIDINLRIVKTYAMFVQLLTNFPFSLIMT